MCPIVVSEFPSSPGTAGTVIGLVLNPTDDGYPSQLDIGDGNAFRPKAAEFPPPAPKPAYASSYDTEGSVATEEAHYENREITIGLWIHGSSASTLEASLNGLYNMVGQINREGGALKFTTPNGTACYFDLVPEAAAAVTVDFQYLRRNVADVTCTFQARPFWRGAEVDLGSTSETTLPVLLLTELGQAGDVPSLGRLVVTDTESGGKDRWTVIVGGESRYYNSSTAATTSALFLQAEDLTNLSTSFDSSAHGAASSGGVVVRNTDLTTTYQAVLKSSGPPTHKGTFRVWARLYRPTGNTGAVSVRLEWGEGDYTRVTLNDPVSYAIDDREGVFTWANLGIVSIDPASTRWEFRLLAKSTVVGDELDADCFVLFPTEVVYTELSARLQFQNPTSFSARDEFNQVVTGGSDPLAGLTAPVGGVWAGAGDADDFVVEDTGHTAQRTAVSDADAVTGRYAVLGATNYTAVLVSGKFSRSAIGGSGTQRAGVIARYTDTSNWLMAVWETVGGGVASPYNLKLIKRVAGTATTIASVEWTVPTQSVAYYVALSVDAAGRANVWAYPSTGAPFAPMLTAYDPVLATGGALQTGKPGVYDVWTGASAMTRTTDDLWVSIPTSDAAMFASQTLELGHDSAKREPSGGGDLTTISDRRGRYLKIPPAGPEGRSTRLAVLALPNDPYTMGDPGFYDLSAQLYVTPRGLVVPEA